jgi:hypothetical protein
MSSFCASTMNTRAHTKKQAPIQPLKEGQISKTRGELSISRKKKMKNEEILPKQEIGNLKQKLERDEANIVYLEIYIK